MQNYSYFEASSLNPLNDFLFLDSDLGLEMDDDPLKITQSCETFKPQQESFQNGIKFDENYFADIVFNKNEEKTPFVLEKRPKKIIEAGTKMRRRYIEAKKGTRSQTNDVSINVYTLIKNLLEEAKLFIQLNDFELKKIQQFESSKPNISTIKSLLDIVVFNGQKHGQNKQFGNSKKQGLSDFLIKNLESPGIISLIWKSKKMKIHNKLIMVKYLNSLVKACKNPKNFGQWKQSMH